MNSSAIDDPHASSIAEAERGEKRGVRIWFPVRRCRDPLCLLFENELSVGEFVALAAATGTTVPADCRQAPRSGSTMARTSRTIMPSISTSRSFTGAARMVPLAVPTVAVKSRCAPDGCRAARRRVQVRAITDAPVSTMNCRPLTIDDAVNG